MQIITPLLLRQSVQDIFSLTSVEFPTPLISLSPLKYSKPSSIFQEARASGSLFSATVSRKYHVDSWELEREHRPICICTENSFDNRLTFSKAICYALNNRSTLG